MIKTTVNATEIEVEAQCNDIIITNEHDYECMVIHDHQEEYYHLLRLKYMDIVETYRDLDELNGSLIIKKLMRNYSVTVKNDGKKETYN